MSDESPKRKCTVEGKCLLNRYKNMQPQEIVDAVFNTIEVYSDDFSREVIFLLNRWKKESDLTIKEVCESVANSVDEYFELEDEEEVEDAIDFEAENEG